MTRSKETTEEAERLRIFRKAEKMGQDEFGKKVGLNHSVISRYENNRLNIPIDFVKKLHEEFNMSFEWFYTGKGNRKYTSEKSTLIKDVKTLETNHKLLTAQVASLKAELLKLHREFYLLKNTMLK